MLDTKNWVQTSDALLRDEAIRKALSNVLLDRLYQSARVGQQVRDAPPPQLQGLAAPAAAAMRQAATQRVPEILGSDAALAAWEKANEGRAQGAAENSRASMIAGMYVVASSPAIASLATGATVANPGTSSRLTAGLPVAPRTR